MPKPNAIEINWVYEEGSDEARIAVTALTSLGRGGRRLVSYMGMPGRYAALLGTGRQAYANFVKVIDAGARLVVGFQEENEPWKIGVAQPGERPGMFLDRQQSWPWVVVPLGNKAMKGFIGHAYRNLPSPSSWMVFMANTLGIVGSVSTAPGASLKASQYIPTTAVDLPGVDLVDLDARHIIRVVEPPKE